MVRSKKTGRKGYFITFEGGEGAGKSTQIRHLVEWLKNHNIPVVLTLEPGGSPIGRGIRQLLLDPAIKNLSQRTELLLYEADRAQHVDEIVLPALNAGKVVISDRFADSSTVYQGICRKLGIGWVEKLNAFATGGVLPDLVIVLDLPETMGRKRIRERLKKDKSLAGMRRLVKLDRLENESRAFHRQVRKGFLLLAKRHPKRMSVVDATKDETTIQTALQNLVAKKLNRSRHWKLNVN